MKQIIMKGLPAILVLLLLCCKTATAQNADKDSAQNALINAIVEKINEFDVLTTANNEVLPQKIVYVPEIQSLFVLNSSALTVDIIEVNPDKGEKNRVQVDLKPYGNQAAALAYGSGVLGVLMNCPGQLDKLITFGKDGRYLRLFELDSTMQGLYFNAFAQQFIAYSHGKNGYQIYTINMRGGAAYLATAKVEHFEYDNAKQNLSRAEELKAADPYGIEMTIIAMLVVFVALTLLYLTFKYVAKIYTMDLRKRFIRKKGTENETDGLPGIHDTTNELGAAIGLALYFYKNQLHDHENTVLTIRKAAKHYSPWSSKIYGIIKSLK